MVAIEKQQKTTTTKPLNQNKMEKIIKEFDQLSSKMKSLIKINDILISKLQQSSVSSLTCGHSIDNKKK
jgi:hypothetical protein